MNKIIKNRGEGKTTELIKRSAETGYPILIHTGILKSYIEKKAKELSLKIPSPITIKELNLVQHKGRKILIDEADYILQQMLRQRYGIEIDSITLSTNEKNTNSNISISKEKNMKNQFGYIRYYMGEEELEKLVSDKVEEKYKTHPIKLTDVIFNKEDGSVDFHFITIVSNNSYEASHWNTNRVKMNCSFSEEKQNTTQLQNNLNILLQKQNQMILDNNFDEARTISIVIETILKQIKSFQNIDSGRPTA